MGRYEREVYVEVRSTIIQSAVTGQVKLIDSGNKSATNYIAKFDEYLNRCGAIELESPDIPYLGLGPVLRMITAESSSLEDHDSRVGISASHRLR